MPKTRKATLLTPTIDARLLKVCERLRGLATAIEDRYQFGMVHLFTEEFVIQQHKGWTIEVRVTELEDYMRESLDGALSPLPPTRSEVKSLLARLLKNCQGVRGIQSPAAPNPDLLEEIEQLLKRFPEHRC
jgi:hypothetical protein